jgi:hypothetical protein
VRSSPGAEYPLAFSQPVDSLPTFSEPDPPPNKSKKSRKLHAGKSTEVNPDGGDGAEDENMDTANDDLEALARNLKVEPESPQLVKTKKKKRKKTKAQAQEIQENGEDQYVQAAGPVEATDEPLGVLGNLEAPEVPVALEEGLVQPTTEEVEADRLTELGSLDSSRKTKKKKKKSKGDNAMGPRLDLNEDPIAGSDEEAVIPRTERSASRGTSRHDEDGSSRKFRKKTVSIPAVSADVIESSQDNAVSGALQAASAKGVPAPIDFLRRSREPELYEEGQDNVSPSVTRQGRRTRGTSSRSVSASRAEVPSLDLASAPLLDTVSPPEANGGELDLAPSAVDGDVMELDDFEPQSSSRNGNGATTGHQGGRSTQADRELDMEEEEPQLPQLSRNDQSTQAAPEGDDLMSTLDDDTLMAMVSTQPEVATDDNGSVFNALGLDENQQKERISERRKAHAKAAAKESRMALQFMLDSSADAAGATASDAAPGSTLPSINNLLANGSSFDHPNDPEGDTATPHVAPPESTMEVVAGEPPSTAPVSATRTPRVGQSSAQSTPKTARTYSRQPKPSFYERTAEETAQGFTELPSNEVAATPKPKKSRAKRRLPIDIPNDEGSPAKKRSSARAGHSKTPKASKAANDPDAPKSTPGPRRAPETATRSATGFLTGTLTRTEVSQIEGAVEAFRDYHDLEQHQVNTIIQQNPKDPSVTDKTLHNDLWTRIREACPTRPRQKLMNWCRQKFHNFVARATWTEEQDEELRQMVQQFGTKWSIIGQHINRHQKDVRDRWRNYLVTGNNQRKNAWSEEEESQFLEIVAEVLGIFQRERERNPDSEMFVTGKTNEELVDWNVVAERMHFARSRLQCQEKWRRMREANKVNSTLLAAQLESDERWRLKRARHEIASMSHADMYHVVLGIPSFDGTAREDIDINWRPILESQRKKYYRYTAMLLWNRLRQLVPDQENKDVQECAKELIAMYQSDGGTFAIPGDEAFDEAKEEQMLAEIQRQLNIGVAKARDGKKKVKDGEKKARGGKSKQQTEEGSPEKRVVSEEFVNESDSEDGEGAEDGDSSRANYNETSPVRELASQSQEEAAARDADEVSLDLANGADNGRDTSVDLAVEPAVGGDGEQDDNIDPQLEQLHTSAAPLKQKSKSKSKLKGKGTPSAAKKHKKRYSEDMALDPSPKKRPNGVTTIEGPAAEGPQGDGGGGSSSRKRARADAADTPDSSAVQGRKSKRAKRAAQIAEQQADAAEGVVSSDDDMGDIPARAPQVA